jgi:ABC-2 type transport system permease protein
VGENRPGLVRTFWGNALFSPKTTLGFMRVDFVVGEVFILSLTQMVFFAFVATLAGGGASSVAYVVVGNAVSSVTYSSVFSVCQTTDSEKQQGTLEPLLATPAGRVPLYLGRGLIPILLSLATVAVGLLYAVGLYHVPVATGALGPLALSVVLTAFAMVGFGLLLGGIALFLRTSIILGNIFLFLGLVVSGVNFPVSVLPLPLRWVGYAFPLTWGVASVRATLSGAALSQVLPLWGYLLLSGLASYALAMVCLWLFEGLAYRSGSLVRF